MKIIFLFFAVLFSGQILAQSLSKMPDSVRTQREQEINDGQYIPPPPPPVEQTDEMIKNRLVKLAMNNPALDASEAKLRIAEIDKKRAKSSILGSVNLGANINEFVINNSAAASFFPKYNLGVAIPLDLFSKTKALKRTATQNILIAEAEYSVQENNIREAVLMLYENYKEKKQLLELQKISMEEDYTNYQRAQQDYADEVISLMEMNRFYKAYITEKANLVSLEKEMNIATIQLETIIGTTMEKALPAAN